MAAQKNPTTKETLQLIEYQIEQIFKEINNLNEDNKTAHTEVKKDLRFIKQNLFDPNGGIWAEVKQNSNFRKDTIKWRSALGLGVFSLIGKQMYDFFKSLS
jgi:uncharacterized membrane protein YgaE (UPF0421/DUF939 family)